MSESHPYHVNKAAVLVGVMLAMFLSALDQTIVATSLPKIVQDLNGLEHLSWVFTAYMLASTVTVPLYGKLSDIYGRRALYFVAITVFLIGSALCGQAHTMNQLIAFRAIQGLGAGGIMVNSIALIGDLFSPAERGRYQGLIGGVFGIASIAGPLLGGWITDHASWRWVFYVNLPVGVIALAVLAAVLPKIVTEVRARSIDFLGAFLLPVGLIPLLLALVWGGTQYAWTSLTTLSLIIGGLIALALFIYVESRVKEPILDLSFFKNRVFSVSLITTFLISMGMFGAILYVPLFAQGVTQISATNAGLVLTPLMVGLIIASAVTGQAISRTGRYKVIAVLGVALSVLGMYLFSRAGIGTGKSGLIVDMAILGVGLGMTMPIFNIAVQSAFERSKLGQVTASLQLFRSVGGTFGSAVLGGILNHYLANGLPALQAEPYTVLTNSASQISVDSVQSVLQPIVRTQIEASFLKLPDSLATALRADFAEFFHSVQTLFSTAFDKVFLFATAFMLAAFVAVLFLPEVELRQSHRPAVEEAGAELEAELGQMDAPREPELL